MTSPVTDVTAAGTTGNPADQPELTAEDLIEEVSIDGMCGVY